MDAKKDNKELTIDYTEIAVDKVIEESAKYLPVLNDIAEEVPIVRTFLMAVKIPKSINDAILANKVREFLYNADLTTEKIDKFRKDFKKEKQKKLLKSVVYSIHSHDDEMKSQIIGKLFNMLIDGYIDEAEFDSMVHATNMINTANLTKLKDIYMLQPKAPIATGLSYNLSSLGLLDVNNSTVGTMGGGGPKHPPTTLGWKYVGIVFNFPQSGIKGYKIGDGYLVGGLDDNRMVTDTAYPVGYVIEKKMDHLEISLFGVNTKGQLIVNKSDGRPYILDEYIVKSDESPNYVAGVRYASYPKGPKGVLYKQLDNRIITSMLVETNEVYDQTIVIDLEVARQRLFDRNSDQEDTYYVEVIDQIKRFVLPDGELHDQWI